LFSRFPVHVRAKNRLFQPILGPGVPRRGITAEWRSLDWNPAPSSKEGRVFLGISTIHGFVTWLGEELLQRICRSIHIQIFGWTTGVLPEIRIPPTPTMKPTHSCTDCELAATYSAVSDKVFSLISFGFSEIVQHAQVHGVQTLPKYQESCCLSDVPGGRRSPGPSPSPQPSSTLQYTSVHSDTQSR
jgi:hypothetical protein